MRVLNTDEAMTVAGGIEEVVVIGRHPRRIRADLSGRITYLNTCSSAGSDFDTGGRGGDGGEVVTTH
jgi:hypothetical protein